MAHTIYIMYKSHLTIIEFDNSLLIFKVIFIKQRRSLSG